MGSRGSFICLALLILTSNGYGEEDTYEDAPEIIDEEDLEQQEPMGRSLPLERGAVYGHSPLSANPKERFLEPISVGLPPLPNDLAPNNEFIYGPPPQEQGPILKQGDFPPELDYSTPLDTRSLDPSEGLRNLDYVRSLIENYPDCNGACDLTRWNDCTCVYPAAYSNDGRGNCNVGATKPDLKVWCYVDERQGDPRRVCPDAKPSKSKPGYFWSRVACITD